MSEEKKVELPSLSLIEHELNKRRNKRDVRKIVFSAAGILLCVAAVFVLLSMLMFPVAIVNQSSMEHTISDGNIIIFSTFAKIKKGDIVAFRNNNRLMVKRVIATAGETVDIDAEGNVSVDGAVLYEPFIFEPGRGECTVPLPLTIPEGKLFVMGDHRRTSIDSRSKDIGPVDMDDQFVGKAWLRIWPLTRIGFVKHHNAEGFNEQ